MTGYGRIWYLSEGWFRGVSRSVFGKRGGERGGEAEARAAAIATLAELAPEAVIALEAWVSTLPEGEVIDRIRALPEIEARDRRHRLSRNAAQARWRLKQRGDVDEGRD